MNSTLARLYCSIMSYELIEMLACEVLEIVLKIQDFQIAIHKWKKFMNISRECTVYVTNTA